MQLTDADLEAIVAEELGTAVEEGFALDVLEVQGGHDRACRGPASWSAATAASPRRPPRATG